MSVQQFHQKVEQKLGDGFAAYGRFVYRHAKKVLILSLVINGALGIGLLRLKWDIDARRVYLPQGTQARDDKHLIEDLFPDLSGTQFNSLQISSEGLWVSVILKTKVGNLLNKSVLEEVGSLSSAILNISAEDDNGSIIKFSDICAISNHSCWVGGDIFWNEEFLLAVENKKVTFQVFPLSTGLYRYSPYIGGNISTDHSGMFLTGMEYIRLEYRIRTDHELYARQGAIWIDKFMEVLSAYSNKYIDLAYGHFNSLNEELDKTVVGDISLFVIALAIMFVYACIATIPSRLDLIRDKIWLGMAGTLAAGLAILSSFGLCAASGVEFVSIAGGAPFLVIGIGIDDMFILLAGLASAWNKPTIEDKIANTLRSSGVGITITSLTDLIAFMAGAGSSIIAVRNFCIYTGIAVLFCYINNITFFAACLVINEHRIMSRKHKKELENKDDPTFLNDVPDTHKTGLKGERYSKNYIDRCVEWVVPKLVIKFPIKIIIVFVFLGYLAASIYGCIYMKQGLLFTQLVNDDSYFYKFSDWSENYFPRQTSVSLVITRVYDYCKTDTYQMVNGLVKDLQTSKFFDSQFEVNWLKNYYNSSYFNCSSELAFVTGVKAFMKDQHYAMFENDVVFASDRSVKASRVYVLTSDLADSIQQGQMMLESRDIASSSSINCLTYSPFFLYYEQYVRILGLTMQSVGIALAAVCVITCVFIPHPVLAGLVTINVTTIMTGVFGFMYYLDISLSAITMIQLIMTVGFSVDFSAHICHGFILCTKATRNERIKETIKRTGAPVFHGAMSSLLGVFILISAKSYIFRTFLTVMSFVLLFGITHALFLLPVMLSWIGPKETFSVLEQKRQDNKQQDTLINKENMTDRTQNTLTIDEINIDNSCIYVEEAINDPNIRETDI